MGIYAPFEGFAPTGCSRRLRRGDGPDLRHVRRACASLALAFALLAVSSHAEEAALGERTTAEDIILTADAFCEGEIGKSDIHLLAMPQAISVGLGDRIKARGITDFNDALRTVAAVSYSNTYGYYEAYTIRSRDAGSASPLRFLRKAVCRTS